MSLDMIASQLYINRSASTTFSADAFTKALFNELISYYIVMELERILISRLDNQIQTNAPPDYGNFYDHRVSNRIFFSYNHPTLNQMLITIEMEEFFAVMLIKLCNNE